MDGQVLYVARQLGQYLWVVVQCEILLCQWKVVFGVGFFMVYLKCAGSLAGKRYVQC